MKKKKIRNKSSLSPTSGAKKKRIVKARVAKPYNHGTMSESAFWGFIRSTLRQKSRWWKPITECKKAARKNYDGTNKRLKYVYQCNRCKDLYPEKQVQVHHIDPVGSLKSYNDIADFIKRLFCEVDGLEVLCSGCHDNTHKKLKEDE